MKVLRRNDRPALHLAALVAACLSIVACDRGTKSDDDSPPEPATTRTAPADAGAVARPEPKLEPCISRAHSNLDGVSIEFPAGTKCSYSLDEVKAGISIPWKLKVEKELQVLPQPQDAGSCGPAGDHGLITFAEIGDGFENRWCLCDEGECATEQAATTLAVGEHDGTVEWDGVNWTGPSDTENPKGEPFGPGLYTVRVNAIGHAGPNDEAPRFEVEAILPITLHDGDAPDRSVTAVRSGALKPAKAWAGAISKGMTRPANEDRYLVAPELGLFAVADGMGGAAAGEVAAQWTIDALERAWVRGRSGALTPVLVEANTTVVHGAQLEPARKGMGTTIVALSTTSDPSKVRIANVGDSRIYRLRDGKLKQETTDHSLVQKLVDLGQITQQEASVHPKRNIITRAIGTRPQVEVDEETISVRPDDVFLLATDGVHGMITDVQIERTLQMHTDLQDAADALVELSNQAGGRDNISVVLVRF